MAILDLLKKIGLEGRIYAAGRPLADSDIDPDFRRSALNPALLHENPPPKNGIIDIRVVSQDPLFKYFLDGSRLTYKVAEYASAGGEYLPLVAGQIRCGATVRTNGRMKSFKILSENAVAYTSINQEDIEEVESQIRQMRPRYGTQIPWRFHRYESASGTDRPEDLGIAKIQAVMRALEIDLLGEMVQQKQLLNAGSMLIIDGSLQFPPSMADDVLFENVIGVSKSFNPNLAVLKKDNTIGKLLVGLEHGQRTAVFKYPNPRAQAEQRTIGVWYIRIRDRMRMSNPLDGIVKLEKVAIGEEIESGFDSEAINNISAAILLERNVTCHGKDKRWHSHLYPVYLTEEMLKSSFLNSNLFLNLF